MNKKVLIFSLYCVLIITALVLFLVFFPPSSADATKETPFLEDSQVQDDENLDSSNEDDTTLGETDNNDPIDSPIEKPDIPSDSDETDEDKSDSGNESQDSSPEIDVGDENQDDEPAIDTEDKIVYATSLVLNCPRSITINLGESVILLNGYISIKPEESSIFLKYEITNKYGSEDGGISFLNNIITANKIGKYSIDFTIPKSKNQHLKDSIQVSVEENENSNIIQLVDSLEIGSDYKLDDVFQINTNADMRIEVLDTNCLIYEDETFIPLSKGNAKILIQLKYDYILYNYSFSLTIRLKPEYTIEIYSDNSDELKLFQGEIFPLMYNIIDKNGITAYQKISVVSSNSAIVEVLSTDHPLIYLNCKSRGEIILTITCLLDDQVRKEIKIVVE